MSHLILMSGGPDSLWAAKHVLTTETGPYQAVYVDMRKDNIQKPQIEAVKKQITELRKIAPISLTVTPSFVAPVQYESKVDPQCYLAFANTVLLGSCIWSVILENPLIDKVWMGINRHDMEEQLKTPFNKKHYGNKTSDEIIDAIDPDDSSTWLPQVNMIAENMVLAVIKAFDNADSERNISFKYAPLHKTKAEIKNDLGELWNLSWSCASPILGNPCGLCSPCLERASA
jgi:7-cyano-7-deazaguanine synthase in queuosine biosynthesis